MKQTPLRRSPLKRSRRKPRDPDGLAAQFRKAVEGKPCAMCGFPVPLSFCLDAHHAVPARWLRREGFGPEVNTEHIGHYLMLEYAEKLGGLMRVFRGNDPTAREAT